MSITGALLWAAAGSTTPGHRVSPSARGTYPVATTLVAGNVDGLAAGAYRYDPVGHVLTAMQSGDHRRLLAAGTLDAGEWLPQCPALLLLTADLGAARRRFPDQPPEHGERFVWIEVGHAAQNVYLTAAERGLGTCLLAGIDDQATAVTCRPLIPDRHQVLSIMGLGFART